MFATVFIGIINLEDGTLSYANCGNEPPLLLSEGSVVASLKPTGPALGAIPDAEFSVKEVLMKKGELLLAVTDGIPDSKNADGVFFGKERLMAILNGYYTTPAILLDSIRTQLAEFVDGADQFDDITVLAVKRAS